MAIVQLDKMTLYGAESQKESVIERLQDLGCVHLVNLSMNGEGLTRGNSLKETRDALRYLLDCPEQHRQVVRKEGFNRSKIVAQVQDLQRDSNRLSDERDDLRTAIVDLEPWGEFRLSTDRSIGNVKFWFFVMPLGELTRMADVGLSWYEISRDYRFAYILILNHEEPANIPGTPCELDPRPLSELSARLEEVEEQLAALHYGRVGLTRWCDQLTDSLNEADDASERERAMRKTLDGQSVFALQGWIPRDAAEKLLRFADENHLAVTIEPPSEDDTPPTLLHNPEHLVGSEALVTFYKTPKYQSWDPSILAYFSFAIFFAIIIADAGYGFVLALLTGYFWRQMGKTQSGRRSRNVLATLVGFTIGYGVICGSYFGVSPPLDAFLGRLKILDAESQSTMMPISILIGVIHLSLANLAIAWLQRGSATALAPLGWVAVMAGATLAGMAAFAEISTPLADGLTRFGAMLLIGGLLAVFLFTSARPILSLSIKNHALRVLDGLQGLTGFSGLFGDVLSYLRLFALGLSSAKLSQTFNALGASAWDAAGFGVIAAIAIVILGHTLNLLLCIMSAVVHGLRLNCIEFFKWGLPEEGYSYKAFSRKARQT